ncbi:MAG: LysM peptidoglycan-binding domain-containing protein [Eubacterium sp.]|nr:LysM peptidoglycan-binding domain-containing protein [Eubacterium sp.]
MKNDRIRYPGPLYFGDDGVLVKYVQLALHRAGYDVKIDGRLGKSTQAAVEHFLKEDTNERDWQQPVVDRDVWQRLLPYLKGYVWHRVEEGEALWQIAGKYQTPLPKVMIANPGLDPDRIQIGTMLVIPLPFPLVSEEVEYTSFLTACIVEGLEKRYPYLEAGNIGSSVMGKPIYYMRIGKGETEVFYNASFHANEWITTPVLLKFAESFAKAYGGCNELFTVPAAKLFWSYSLYLAPMVNPDGVDLVNGVLEQVSGLSDEENETYLGRTMQIAAGYPQIPYPSGWKANIAGTDLNLQFPAGWEIARGIKFEQGYTTPAPRDYVGEAPLTAPESKAVYDFTREHDFQLILAYHTQGEVIYWKYLDYEPEHAEEIVRYFEEVSGYVAEKTPYASAYAGYKDWFIMEYVRPGYTIEVGTGINPLQMEQFQDIYEKNRLILEGGMSQLEQAGQE